MNIRILYLFLSFSFFAKAQSPFTQVKTSMDQEDYKTSLRILDSCAGKNYHEDSVILYNGLVNLKKGNIKGARLSYKRLKKLYPAFNEMHYLNGLIFFSDNDYASSIDEFNLVIEKQPMHYKAIYNRSIASGLLEDYLSAIEDLSACISLNSKNPIAYYSRAYWYEYTGNYFEAKKDYEQTISLDPKNYDAYFGLANIQKIQGENTKACETINKAVSAGSQIAEELKEGFCR